jgi:hypothetical protein
MVLVVVAVEVLLLTSHGIQVVLVVVDKVLYSIHQLLSLEMVGAVGVQLHQTILAVLVVVVEAQYIVVKELLVVLAVVVMVLVHLVLEVQEDIVTNFGMILIQVFHQQKIM